MNYRTFLDLRAALKICAERKMSKKLSRLRVETMAMMKLFWLIYYEVAEKRHSCFESLISMNEVLLIN